MKIKIRIKTIIKLVAAGLFIYLMVIPIFTLTIANKLDDKYESDKARLFYESYLNRPIKLQDTKATYRYAVNLIGDPYKYTIMMQHSGGSGDRTTLENLDKAKMYLEEIIDKNPKGDDREYYHLSYEKLMDLSMTTQNTNELIEWIDWGQKNEDEKINYLSHIYNSYLNFVNRDYNMALKILNNYIDKEEVDYRYYFLKGYISLFQGDNNGLRDNFRKAFDTGVQYEDTLFGTASYKNREFWLEKFEQNHKGEYKIRGRVTFNGQPMPFVEIYVTDNYGGFSSSGEDFVGITDINGEFETLGFKEGRYDIGVGLSDGILYDKVFLTRGNRFIDIEGDISFDFAFSSPMKVISPKQGTIIEDDNIFVKWDEVEGAAYYDVQTIVFENQDKSSGSSFRFSILYNTYRERLTETSVNIDLNKLKNRPGGISWGGDDMIVNPYGILGSFIKGYEYPLVVNAYDSDGNLVSSSLPMLSYYENMPSIKLEGQLTDGEKLINNREYEKAIEYYEGILRSDPKNEEALIYLTKIYYISYKKDKADYDKALEYAKRYDELKNDSSLIIDTLGFMDHDARRKYQDLLLKTMDDVPEENRRESYYYDLGRLHLSLKNYEVARELFENSEILNTNLLFIDLYLGDLEKAHERIDNNIELYRMDKMILKESIENIDVNQKDYEIIKEIIEMSLSEDLEDTEEIRIYEDKLLSVNNLHIKNLLKQIGLNNNWDNDY